MKNLWPEEENVMKNIRNFFRLEKETKGIFVQNIINQ